MSNHAPSENFSRDNKITETSGERLYTYTDIDGEEYTYTQEEIQEYNRQVLQEYEERVSMTPYEKRALRKWVASGHNPLEHPGSRYICLAGAYPPPDFLSVYRMDRELKQAMKGMTKAERTAYLQDYTGYEEEPEEVQELRKLKDITPPFARDYIHRLERKDFYTREFLSHNSYPRLAELNKYVEEHLDEPLPFEW